MKIKSLHKTKVKIPVPGKDPIVFKPMEELEVSDEIGKKLLESKGFMLPQREKVDHSREEFFKLNRKKQEEVLKNLKIEFIPKDKEEDLWGKYSENE